MHCFKTEKLMRLSALETFTNLQLGGCPLQMIWNRNQTLDVLHGIILHRRLLRDS